MCDNNILIAIAIAITFTITIESSFYKISLK